MQGTTVNPVFNPTAFHRDNVKLDRLGSDTTPEIPQESPIIYYYLIGDKLPSL
jgi:hypothetical protein